MKNKIIESLFGFKSFIFDNISLSGTDVNLFFHRDKRKSLVCPHCGSLMGKNREIERTVYDLCPCSERFLRITFKTYQGRCSNCGKTKTFLPDEVSEKMKVTKRLQLYAFKLCCYASAAEVAELFSCSDDMIRRWDMAILKEQYESVDWIMSGIFSLMRNLLVNSINTLRWFSMEKLVNYCICTKEKDTMR